MAENMTNASEDKGLVGNADGIIGGWTKHFITKTENGFICKKGEDVNIYIWIFIILYIYPLGTTFDQCTVDADYFTSQKSCKNSSSSGFDKDIINKDLPMIDVFLNKDKRKDLLLMEAVMRYRVYIHIYTYIVE